MQTAQMTSNILIGGVGITSQVSRQGDGQISYVADLAAGIAGLTSATGVSGLPTGHGISMGATVGVSWTDSGGFECRRYLSVSAADANTITFDWSAGEGDAAPAHGTACIVALLVTGVLEFSGDAVAMIAARASQAALVDFRSTTGSGSSIVAVKLPAGEAWVWADDQGIANPLTGTNVVQVRFINFAATAATVAIGVLYTA
jgi:hypothetical protein